VNRDERQANGDVLVMGEGPLCAKSGHSSPKAAFIPLNGFSAATHSLRLVLLGLPNPRVTQANSLL
jgi:hypothetical protein